MRRVQRYDPQLRPGRSQSSSHSGSDQSVPLAREVEDRHRTLLELPRCVDREHLLHTACYDATLDRADRGRRLLRELSRIRPCEEHANRPQGWPDPEQGRDWPAKWPPTPDRALHETRSQYDSKESSGSAGRQTKCNRPREGLGDQHEVAEATKLARDSVTHLLERLHLIRRIGDHARGEAGREGLDEGSEETTRAVQPRQEDESGVLCGWGAQSGSVPSRAQSRRLFNRPRMRPSGARGMRVPAIARAAPASRPSPASRQARRVGSFSASSRTA